jgi:ATP-dependent protease ClpP protease subunit
MSKNEICLFGSVGGSWWDESWFTANQVREELEGRSGPLTVRINSGGGIASEGQAIYTQLRNYPDQVNVVIEGAAMSAASLIAMAGDTITMTLGSFLLIHDPASMWTQGRGTEEDHLKQAKQLAITANGYAAIYAKRSGKSLEEAREVMRVETLLDGALAVAEGFATAVDDQSEPATAATWDYRLYKNAPAQLREASEKLGKLSSQAAAMAIFAGAPRQKQEMKMTVPTTAAAGATPQTQPAVQAPDPKVAVMAERQRINSIENMLMVAKLPADVVTTLRTELVDGDADLTMASAKITEAWAKLGDQSPPAVGREPARITRDEVETRRQGMQQAMIAQVSRAAPQSDAARPFMDLSLVEMAAICADYKGPIRNAGDRTRVFEMAAGHSRSDFTGIFENALNKMLLDRYEAQQPTYRRLAKKKNFKDFRPHPMVRAGDFPKPQAIGENGEIKFGTFGEKRETAVLSSYAVGLRFSRQMMIDDDLDAINDVIVDYGTRVADFEEELFYTFMATATLASDGVAVWSTAATRLNLAASGTAITVAALGAGRAAMQKQTSIDGVKLNIQPKILLVGPDKLTEAEQLVASITANDSVKVNPFSAKLDIVSTAQITGNKWYLFADPNRSGGACFVYGYLDGAEAPRIRTEEPFGQQGMAMTLEMDFGLGGTDFRGTYQNPGA